MVLTTYAFRAYVNGQLMFFLGFSSSDTGCPSKFLVRYTYSAIFQSSEKLGYVCEFLLLLLLLLLRPASLRELPHIWLRKSFRIYPRSGRFSVLSYLEQFPHGVALHPTLPLLRTNHLSLLQGQEWYNSVWEPGLLRQEKLAASSLVLSDKRGHWGHFDSISHIVPRVWAVWYFTVEW